jgi:negative regulator of flagellin synthesis FlgM
MTDKIIGQGFRPTDTASTRRSDAAKQANSQAQSSAAAAPDKAATARDTVSITQSGLLMSKLEEIVQRTPIVDQERVAAIKEAIASGKYEIDDQRVADRMLRLERELG